MILYHGTPISGPDVQAAKFLARRHALISFMAQQHLPVAAEVCSSFVLDNGAFSVWKKGVQLDVPGFIQWTRKMAKHPGFDWALIPDVIDGDEADNDRLLDQWPSDLVGVPVWHLHESINRLERLAKNFRTVALGSSGQYSKPNSKKWWLRMEDVLDAICDEHGHPPCRLHGLRMADPRIFTRIPFASVDSTNVGVNVGSRARFGYYIPPSESVRAEMIADRIEAFNSPAVWVGI